MSDEFEDVFASITDGEPETQEQEDSQVEDTPESDQAEPAAPAAAEAETPTPVDPWSAAPAELRTEYQRAQHAAQSQAGRVAALQRQIQELKAKVEAPPQPTVPPTEDEDWKRVREEYPDLAAPVEKHISRAAEIARQEAIRLFNEQQQQAYEAAQIEKENLALLAKEHPDFRELLAEPEFGIWRTNVTPRVEALIASDSAEDASVALHLYKRFRDGQRQMQQHKQETQTKRSLQLESARTAPPGRKPSTASGPSEDTYEAWFDHIT